MIQTPEVPHDPLVRLLQEKAACQTRIAALERRSAHALGALSLFLIISLVTGFGLDYLPSLEPEIRAWLGSPPPVQFIHAALLIYSFSALLLIFSQMTIDQPPPSIFPHVAYLAAFYVIYHLSDGGWDSFLAVLAAGFLILGLAGYRLRSFCRNGLQEERETLQILERRERFFAGQETGEESS